jgi:hypothetical protein
MTMKKRRAPADGNLPKQSRKHRPRLLPKWLTSSTHLEAVARSRCLMVLSVLSGEMPVTDAIEQAKISRATYYQLETRALKAMLSAMNPLSSSTDSPGAELSAASWRIEQLQAQVRRLEQERRRGQRLLLLMRKALRAPVTSGHRGRWPRGSRSASSVPGGSASQALKLKRTAGDAPIPTPPGEHSP